MSKSGKQEGLSAAMCGQKAPAATGPRSRSWKGAVVGSPWVPCRGPCKVIWGVFVNNFKF